MSIFNERLKECRKSETTQKAMAEYLGVSERAYQHYEAGTREPNFDLTVKIADYFKVSVDYLLGRTDNPMINR